MSGIRFKKKSRKEKLQERKRKDVVLCMRNFRNSLKDYEEQNWNREIGLSVFAENPPRMPLSGGTMRFTRYRAPKEEE